MRHFIGRPAGSWRGAANPRYKGGRYTTKAGYVFVYMPDHPSSDKRGYIREHVLVMSSHIGRAIASGEVVHHKNEDPSDNRIENLELTTVAVHATIHHLGKIKPASLASLHPMTSEWQRKIRAKGGHHYRVAKPRTCDYCGKQFKKERLVGRDGHKHQFCDRKCFQDFRRSKSTKAN